MYRHGFAQDDMTTSVNGSASPTYGFKPILRKCTLVFLHFGACSLFIAFVFIPLYGVPAPLNSDSLESIEAIGVKDFENYARQTTELPWACFYRNG